MPTGDKLYEDLQKEREENKKAMAVLMARLEEYQKQLGGMNQAQPESVNLNKDEISEFKNRLSKNLNRREDAADYLTGLLYRKTPDPTDPLADMIIERSPAQMQKELKAEARQGKSKVGNFFRNIDYFLGDGATRDLGISNKIQSEARTNLDNLLKDQGTEIQRAFQMQNALSGKVAAQNQKNVSEAGKLATDSARIQNQSALGDMNTGIRGAQAGSIIDLNSTRQKLLQQQAERAEIFAPLNHGSKQFQDAYSILQLRAKGRHKEADQLEQKITEAKNRDAKLDVLKSLSMKGMMPTTREQVIQGQDPTTGNVTFTKVPVTTSSSNPYRQMLLDQLDRDSGAAKPNVTSSVKFESSEPQTEKSAVELMRNTAAQNAPPKKALTAVNKALAKVSNERQRQYIAAQSLSDGLTPQEMEVNAGRAALGHRYTILPPSTPKDVTVTGLRKGGQQAVDKNLNFAEYDLKLTTPAKSIMRAAAKGQLEKAFGASNNILTTVRNVIGGTMPEGFRKATTSEIVEDPTKLIDNTFPNLVNSRDPEINSFVTSLKELVSSAETAIQLKNTGKAATEFEIQRLANRLPKPSDTPQVALEKMLNFAITEKVGGYLASKGYTKEQIQRAHNYMSDFVSPRVQDIVKQIGDAKSAYANKLVSKPEDAIRNLDLNSLDPEDIYGEALYEYTKKTPGATLKDIQKATQIRVSRLIPDDSSPSIPIGEDLLNSLSQEYNVPRRKKK